MAFGPGGKPGHPEMRNQRNGDRRLQEWQRTGVAQEAAVLGRVVLAVL